MHQNKLLAVVVIVVGVLGSLAIVSNMGLAPGECIIVKLPGDSGVERCKEGDSNLNAQQTTDFKAIIEETTQLEIQRLEAEKEKLLQSEQQNKEQIALIDQSIKNTEIQQTESLKALPYLQPSDYELLQQNLEQIKSETKQLIADNQRMALSTVYVKQKTYAGDCSSRPEGTVCLIFPDGYVWLINEPVIDWEDRTENGKSVRIAIGSTSKFYHILDTELVKTELK